MFDSSTLFVVGLGLFALVLAFLEYAFSNKKRTKVEVR
jgi:hypothetical protein